ncbi:MAG TPA: PPC domain-containing protein [Polyangia bacterium]|nr:PPC domain-containing protein [Polyangia bacterium]
MKGGQALLGLGIVVGLFGCGGRSSPPVGQRCQVNTDCANPLSCTFGQCHVTCRDARDCAGGQRCVAAPGGAVCQPEGKCNYLSECPRPLVCALDRQCRSECKMSIDCATKTQTCVSGVCAEPQEVDSTGKLKNAEATAVPDAPDGGVLDMGVVPPPADGPPPADAPPPTDGSAPADAPAPDLAPLPPDLNLGDIPVGPCGFQDPYEPTNDKRETAIQLAPGVSVQGCVAGKDPTVDSDWFEVVAPNDPAGGYFQVALTDVGPDKVGVTTYAASDNTIILDGYGGPDPGASVNVFFAAAPGQRYRLLVSYGSYDFLYKMPFRYTIRATYTKVNDTFEPNDTRAAARPIALGTPITAFLFAGFITGHAGFENGKMGSAPTADWYKVEASAGMVKATVDNTAGDVRTVVFIYDSLGTERARADSVTYGAGASATVAMAVAGTYYVQVLAGDQGPISAAPRAAVSPSFTVPYTLTVSQ